MMVWAIHREKRRYIQHFDANRLHSEKRWIQSNSMDLLFFFSFSPFYLLLSQRRTFFNILPFETRRREEKRRKGGERGGGGRERRLFNKEERHQNLSLRVFGLKLFWRSFRAKIFIQRRRRKKREKIHKSNLKCLGLCLSLFSLYYTRLRAALGPVQLFWFWFWCV